LLDVSLKGENVKLLALLALIATQCFAAVIFHDTFDASLPATQLNADIPNWTESNGTIDYIKDIDFGIRCLGNAGGCVDLDGSTGDAGDLMTSAPISLLAGYNYTLSYYLAGNQRNGPSDTLNVSFAGQTNSHTLASNAPWTAYSITVAPVANASTAVLFSHVGGDNIGIILDSVVVEQTVPEPSSIALFGAGGLAIAFLRRRARV
jgi:hypothetical protein